MTLPPSSRSLPFRGRLGAAGLLLVLALPGAVVLRAANLPPGFAAPAESDFRAARIDPTEPELKIEFPGVALHRGIAAGTAVVSVAIDAQGRATDFLLVGCSDRAFGRALLDAVKPLKFQPAAYRGAAVPGRCDIGYRFEYHSAASGAHSYGFSAWGVTSGGLQVGAAMPVDLLDLFSGKSLPQKPAYVAVAERNLDQPLEFTDVALPKLPSGYAAPADKPVKVFVTFYIDEEGRVRMPTVESDAPPELVAGALKAVRMWSFRPPVAHGKPALVLTARPVGFLPRVN